MSHRAKTFAVGGMCASFAVSAWTLGPSTPELACLGIPMAVAAV